MKKIGFTLLFLASQMSCQAPALEDPTQGIKAIDPTPRVIQLPTYASFTGEIEPLLKSNCLSCHALGRQAPDLSNYEALAANNCALAKKAVQEVKDLDMPKLHRLTFEEIQAFKKWQDSGFPKMPAGQPNTVLCDPN